MDPTFLSNLQIKIFSYGFALVILLGTRFPSIYTAQTPIFSNNSFKYKILYLKVIFNIFMRL